MSKIPNKEPLKQFQFHLMVQKVTTILSALVSVVMAATQYLRVDLQIWMRQILALSQTYMYMIETPIRQSQYHEHTTEGLPMAIVVLQILVPMESSQCSNLDPLTCQRHQLPQVIIISIEYVILSIEFNKDLRIIKLNHLLVLCHLIQYASH